MAPQVRTETLNAAKHANVIEMEKACSRARIAPSASRVASPLIERGQTDCPVPHPGGRASRLRRAATLLVACLLVGCTPVPPVQNDSDDTTAIDDTPHITVVGRAAAQTVPDTFEIRLGVTSEKPTAAAAWEANSALAQALVEAAKAAGVKPQDIGTTRIDLAQQFETARQPDGTTTTAPRGFKASYMLRIRLNEIGKVGTLTQILIEKGANDFEGIGFSSAHPEALLNEVQGEAMRDARHQAETLADAAGVKLGALLQVERPDQNEPAGRPLTRSLAQTVAPMEPGMQTISAEVEATYTIQ